MTPSPLRDALLAQMGGSSIAAELNTLNELVNAEARRARRLTIWTVVVWAAWFGMFVLYFALPMISRTSTPPRGSESTLATTQPSGAGAPVPPRTEYGFLPSALEVIVSTSLLAAFFGLPPVGIVLLILMILARRSASMSRVRASLASIDAQLRLLVAQRGQPPGGPQGSSGASG